MPQKYPSPGIARGVSSLKLSLLIVASTLVAASFNPAAAATLCVNAQARGGCYVSIQAAVDAAAANDTVRVAPGRYAEDVTIGKPLSLIGAGAHQTVIDASGQANGVSIDGLDNAGLSDVVVSGFTVKNAKFEGIVITDATGVTVSDNRVVDNNASLAAGACPGIPNWETLEGFDCGEGIHLSGVDHSTIANNLVANNAGGILLSDDTGATHDNLITGNRVENNPYDCGITLASHPPAPSTGASSAFGVFHNTIAENLSSGNGVAIEGAGAGVGMFASAPGTKTYGNVVVHNRLTDNGLPGVAMHSHTPGQDLSDNAILDNYIAGNGADTEDAATPGPTGINVFGVSAASGTVISQNVIKDEQIGIATKNPAQIDAHLNDLDVHGLGVDNLGDGTVQATQNWWGCRNGPGASGCAGVDGGGVATAPALTRPFRDR